ncbi:TetR/AcrR family transcriptional regulator [Sphingobium aquiterrae]|uniref:TetR/AcrR family transcriptional regulator n=1 Tax=Sphingobium aquiterrae TaxID=2038656 RepID=UPI0030163FF7
MARAETGTAHKEGTKRYREKRDRIVDAACELINETGALGMTLADVARRVGLNTTSVTYYFRRKDQLALACYHAALNRFEGFVAQAEDKRGSRAAITAFIAAAFADLEAVYAGDRAPIALLSELRTLEGEAHAEAMSRYQALFRRLRATLGADGKPDAHARLTARTFVLLETIFWLPFWIDRYDPSDFPRVQARMTDLLLWGIAAPGMRWSALPDVPAEPLPEEAIAIGQEQFLQAATRLINEKGYQGASVDRIASEINVTKGSFYHHLDTKDDLVLACFSRSFDAITRAQVDVRGIRHWDRLCASIDRLLRLQFSAGSPLLRSTALQVLPQPVRASIVAQSNRLARRYAGMISDGVADGSIRAVDPLIAAQNVLATVNAACDMRWWAARLSLDDAVAFYGSTLAFGLMSDD